MIRTRQLREASAVLLLLASVFTCGFLTLKTDNMSTLSIEWPAVRSVMSKFDFAIERRDGTKLRWAGASCRDRTPS
jgi:hypothetical protein